jgi:hypothetical protein
MKDVCVRVKVSEQEHRALKVYVTERGTTITEVVRTMIDREMAAAQEQPQKK